MDDKELVVKVRQANKSWQERIASEVHDIQYDGDADIFYANYGEITQAFSLPIDDPDDCVYLRIDAKTYTIVGIEILSFKKLFLARHSDAQQVFDQIFEVFGDSDWRFQILPLATDEVILKRPTPAARASAGYFSAYIPQVAPDLVPA